MDATKLRFRDPQIEMAHGAGGKASRRLVEGLFAPLLMNGSSESLGDAGFVSIDGTSIALTTDTSFLTARANDRGFDTVFERLLEAIGRPGDALIAISTSGESRNVIHAVTRAKNAGIATVGLLGGSGGSLAGLVDLPIVVPGESTQHIQECHIASGKPAFARDDLRSAFG